MDETLRLELDELKQNIVKELPDAKIIGDEFPIKVITNNGTYSVDGRGKVERLSGISLDDDKLLLQIIDGEKEEKSLNAVLTDIEGEITWSSSNPGVATVDNSGNVKAVAEGTATITATCSGETATCNVTVKNVVSISEIKLKIGTNYVTAETEVQEIPKRDTLIITAETNTGATEDVVWWSSDLNVAPVTGSGNRNLTGTVSGIAVSNSEVTIKAKASKGAEASVKVKIVAPVEIRAEDIASDPNLLKNTVTVKYNNKDWNILLTKNNKIYLILKTIVNHPGGKGNLDIATSSSGEKYADYGTELFTDFKENAKIADSQMADRFPAVRDGWFDNWMGENITTLNPNMRGTLYMLDSDVWNTEYRGDKADWAIGGPTMEMVYESHNQYTGSDEVCPTPNTTGYGTGVLGTRGNLDMKSSLYIGKDYWLSGPADYGINYVRFMNGNFVNSYWNAERIPLRSFSTIYSQTSGYRKY